MGAGRGRDGFECSTVILIVIVKFLLFLTNIIIWLLGAGVLALGIYIQIEESSSNFEQALMSISSLITNPAIILIVVGAVLFIIGFCGCFGALLEIIFLLVIYSILLGVVVLAEIALVVYVIVQQDEAYSAFESILQKDIEEYYNDINVRDVIDLIQRDILKCCGINGPGDWESNLYFNCSSVAFQRCSVPPSCCIIEEGQIINLQCGYRTLNSTGERYFRGIYNSGCVTQARNFVNSNLYIILGAGGGLLVFQIICVVLAACLASAVQWEKKHAKLDLQT